MLATPRPVPAGAIWEKSGVRQSWFDERETKRVCRRSESVGFTGYSHSDPKLQLTNVPFFRII